MENKARKDNPWRAHCKEYAEKHPDLKYKQVMVEAKKTYTPLKKPEKVKKKRKVDLIETEEN